MIQGLTTAITADFRGGRVTNANLAAMLPETALVAKDVFFLGDKGVTKRNGYTLVKNVWAGPVQRIYDFQRDLDQAQFVMVNGAGKLGWILAAGGALTTLSAAESATAYYDFAKNLFALYLSNGLKQYRAVDTGGGLLTLFQWGLTPPAVAPGFTLGTGTLTLIYGRQYVVAPVSKYTDSTGTQRVSVGAPSPISANTGPFANGVVELTVPTSTDPQVTHWWIFSTVDSAYNTSSTYYWAAEVAEGTTLWGDTQPDSALDTSRLAPWNNYPPPLASVLVPYQSRIVFLQIPGAPHLVQLSGLEEIDLGIPEETAPPDLAFETPGGQFEIVGAIPFNNALMISTPDFWFELTGYDASTFAKQDRVLTPGMAGKKAGTFTPTHMIWLGSDKRLYVWDGVNPPIDASRQLGKPLVNVSGAAITSPYTLSMDDLSTAQLANAEVRWYAFGKYKFILVLASSSANPNGPFDWMQIWDATWLGLTLSDGSTHYLTESDMFPSAGMTCSAIVEASAVPYLFMGDANGNVYRFPDGFTDAGTAINPQIGSCFSSLSALYGQMFRPLDPGDIVKRLYYADLVTDRENAADVFGLQALASDSPNLDLGLFDLTCYPLQSAYGIDGKGIRASLSQPGTAVGRWFRYLVEFPSDAMGAVLYRVSIANAPIYGVTP